MNNKIYLVFVCLFPNKFISIIFQVNLEENLMNFFLVQNKKHYL